MDPNESDLIRQAAVCRPPDINLPLSVDIATRSSWPSAVKSSDILDVTLGTQMQDLRSFTPSKGKRLVRRGDSIWGAWFFFQHYFRPVRTDELGLRLDQFMVQHDMENMYMWVFLNRPENALGKMQLRSYMNGHARFGEPQFPFSVEKGFTRSHRMQRKHYRGLSNPQCVHGIEVMRNPILSHLSEEAKKRWVELTGRDLNFTLPVEAGDFSAWRTLPCTDLDFERSEVCSLSKCSNGSSVKKQHSPKSGEVEFGGSTLDLSCKLIGQLGGSSFSGSSLQKRKRKPEGSCGNNDEECCAHNGSHSGEILGEESHQGNHPSWLSEFCGVILDASGPVTGAKTIYEDEKGYLILVSLPFTDMARLRVSWLNTATHGVVKIHVTSTALLPVVTRGARTFKLTDANPEHCPEGDFVREIALATRIPDNAELKAFYVKESAGLEIMIPKHLHLSEEREVRVFLPHQLGKSGAQLF
ncbi:hypothetical protein L7F22_017842 [Adiantum nelumboides]|nr:hypothetical protein [Adiantum nelumboides]